MISELAAYNLPCYLIDDGSDAPCREVIRAVSEAHEFVKLLTLPINSGKGTAVCTGLIAAFRDGYTHAIQLDSDGQHSPAFLPQFLEASRQHPQQIVSGCRRYEDMPTVRRRGRRLSDFWVQVNTVSREIKDSMCGYRLYPLAETMRLLNRTDVGKRMDFDSDILVRLYWQGCEVAHVCVSVLYDDSVPSHFAMFADNYRITWMHIKHFFGMWWRLPRLLTRNRNRRRALQR